MLHGMNMLIKAGRSRFISLHFPGKVTPHRSAGSCSQMEFAVVAAPSRRDYQAAFPGQTADLGALLTRAATQQETDKREHGDACSHRTGYIGLLFASAHPDDLWPLFCSQPPPLRCCCAGSAPLPVLLWFVND